MRKLGSPRKARRKISKLGWEIQLETQIKNLQKQAKMIKQKKDSGICRNKKEKATQEKITVQLEEINQKVLVKERRLKRYQQRVKQYTQNRTFQNNERKFDQQLGGDCRDLPINVNRSDYLLALGKLYLGMKWLSPFYNFDIPLQPEKGIN